MKKEKAAVLRRGAWRNVRRTMRRSTGRSCREAYGHSYANPAYAAARLGETFGGALASCGTSSDGMRGGFPRKSDAAYDRDGAVCGGLQLLLKAQQQMPCRRKKEVQQILYWYFHDYREIFDERSVRRLVNPAEDFEKEIVMQADLSDLRYLYRYGAYIGGQ